MFRYTVPADRARDFEKEYGPDGAWARLFRKGAGFLRTELYADDSAPGSYVTIDLWDSDDHYRGFMAAERAAYDALDVKLAPLSTDQECLGRYVLLPR